MTWKAKKSINIGTVGYNVGRGDNGQYFQCAVLMVHLEVDRNLQLQETKGKKKKPLSLICQCCDLQISHLWLLKTDNSVYPKKQCGEPHDIL